MIKTKNTEIILNCTRNNDLVLREGEVHLTIYVGLLILIFLAMIIDHSTIMASNTQKRSNILLGIIFISIFLICVLRSGSVGRDIAGYELAYKMTKDVPFSDFNYIYYENGYLLFMKICVAMKMNFQCFLVVTYLIILFPIFIFIEKFSNDKIFSVLIYICYIIFEFDLTGLRQAIAMSITLVAFVVLIEKKKMYMLWYVLLILLAMTFHKSAIICFAILPLMIIKDIKWYSVIVALITIISLALRSALLPYIKQLFDKDSFNTNAALHIGANVIFMVIMAAYFLYVLNIVKKGSGYNRELYDEVFVENNELFFKIFLLSILLALFFGNETSARSFMFFSQSLIILLPNTLFYLEKKSSIILRMLFVAFFVYFFATNTLIANNFDIVPYKFYWE